MPKFFVEGGHRLQGTIRPAGNKNAALPMLAATLLTEEEVVLENVPAIRDVKTLIELLQALGAEAKWTGPNEVTVSAKEVGKKPVDSGAATRIRCSMSIHSLRRWCSIRRL